MPLSELTTESYFKTATLVRDWRDYHFCGRMFHPPLLTSNWFLFCLCLNKDIYSTCCYCEILLRYAKHLCFKSVFCSSTWMSHRQLCLILVELHKGRSDCHICVGISFNSSSRVVSNHGQKSSVPNSIHMMLWCAFRCCATCIGIVLDKCWIDAIELLSFTIKWAKIVPTQTWCLFLCYNKTLHHPLYK